MKWGVEYDANKQKNEPMEDSVPMSKVKEGSVSGGVDMDRAMRFNVLVCQGGVVLEIRTPDRSTVSSKGYNEPTTRTHIIADGEPVAERIGQIVSMEILRS